MDAYGVWRMVEEAVLEGIEDTNEKLMFSYLLAWVRMLGGFYGN